MSNFDATKVFDGVLDYQLDWSDWLTGFETIASSVWTTTPGITIDSQLNTNATAVIIVSGGVQGTVYSLRNVIVTTGGRTDSRTLTIRVVANRAV